MLTSSSWLMPSYLDPLLWCVRLCPFWERPVLCQSAMHNFASCTMAFRVTCWMLNRASSPRSDRFSVYWKIKTVNYMGNNELNDTVYLSGVVNLYRYKLNEHEESLLAHGLGFTTTLGAPNPSTIFLNKGDFKRRTRLFPFLSDPANSQRVSSSPTPGEPVTHKSFKKNLVSSLHLLTSLSPLWPNWHWVHKLKPVRKEKNLTHLEIKTLKLLRRKQDIIIKPADKGSIMS